MLAGQQYEILDDLSSENELDDLEDEGGQGLSSEESDVDEVVMDEAEIEAMLEEGVSHYPPASVGGAAAKRRLKNAVLADGGDEDFEAPNVVEKIILIGKCLALKII